VFIPIKKLPPLFSPWVHSRSLRSPGPLARLAFRPRAVGRLRAMHYGQNRAPVPLHRSWRKLLGNPDRAKKGDLAKFIEEAVRWRVLDQTVAQTKARNAKVPVAAIEAAINEALHAVRAERFAAQR